MYHDQQPPDEERPPWDRDRNRAEGCALLIVSAFMFCVGFICGAGFVTVF
jgi:hypothetical protein